MEMQILTFSLYLLFGSLVTAEDSERLTFQKKCSTHSPIVIVPGLTGSKLYASLNHAKPPFFCKKSTSKDLLAWLNIKLFLPGTIKCFTFYTKLELDRVKNTTHSPPGVTMKIHDWGTTESIDYFTKYKMNLGLYFGDLTKTLVKENNYKRNVSLRGAPYDFRKAPNEHGLYFEQLKRLIEETYNQNCQQRVLLVTHSMGGLFALHFLHQQSQSWKDKFIQSFVSINVPYFGSIKSLELISCGDNLGIPILKPKWIQAFTKTWPSTSYLLPSPYGWLANETIAMTKNRNYTSLDYEAFFKDMGYPQGSFVYSLVKNITNPLKPPGVKVHCVFSEGVNTPVILDWRRKKFPKDQADHINGNGDGTVDSRSLRACLGWVGKQKETVKEFAIRGVGHRAILKDRRLINYIQSLVKPADGRDTL